MLPVSAVGSRLVDGEESRLARWHYLTMVGGLLVVASLFLTWAGRGAGSSMSLRELGDFALGGSVSTVVSRWVGLLAYVIPLSGAAIVVGAGIEGRTGRVVTRVAAALAAVFVLTAVVVVERRHVGVGAGEVVAIVGLVLVSVAEVTGVVARR
jgi:hypothetical protein